VAWKKSRRRTVLGLARGMRTSSRLSATEMGERLHADVLAAAAAE
jgi:hypothetical protein